MSVSMTPTRKPRLAVRTARFAVVFDFPVPPRNEWVEIIFPNLGLSIYCDVHHIETESFVCERVSRLRLARVALSLIALTASGSHLCGDSLKLLEVIALSNFIHLAFQFLVIQFVFFVFVVRF